MLHGMLLVAALGFSRSPILTTIYPLTGMLRKEL
jgi:hypothetical protein